jgi:hypothetical protein
MFSGKGIILGFRKYTPGNRILNSMGNSMSHFKVGG